jgi:predicted deacylase
VLGSACQRHADEGTTSPTVRTIVGGSAAATCQWPTTVMVNPIGCSGTLVHSRAVVTAKHCLVDEAGNPDPPTSVGIGEAVSSFAKTVAITKCYGHPTNDFAICTLAEAVTEIPIVPAMAPCEMSLLTKGAAVVEAGFGTDKVSNGTYGKKRWIAGTLADNATNSVDITVTSGSQDGEYFGDSGGPLYLRMPDTTWRVVGEDCCSDDIISGSSAPRISTYTSVPFHVAWAEQQTGLDLTPCHDSRGWVAGDQCTGFPTDPGRTGGAWSTMCQGQTLLLAATCGGSIYDGGIDGSGTGIDASFGTVDAETGGLIDVGSPDRSDSEGAERSPDGAGSDRPMDSSAANDSSTGTGGTGGAGGTSGTGGAGGANGTGGAGGSGLDAGSGGTVGSGGAVVGTGGTTGSGGMALGGAAGSAAGGTIATGGMVGLGGQAGTAIDGGGKDIAGGEKGSSSSSGCSCRLENGGRPVPLGLLFVLASLGAQRMRRRRNQETESATPEVRKKFSGPFPPLYSLRAPWLIRGLLFVVLANVTACSSDTKGPPTADARPTEAAGGASGADADSPAVGGADARGMADSPGAGGGAGLDADLPVADAMVSEAPPETDTSADSPVSLDAASGEAGGCTLADTIAVDRLPSLSFTSYHSVADIVAYLSAVSAAAPDVATAYTLGESVRGRAIPYLVINATCQPTAPAVLLVGTHHGDEWSSTEAALANVDYLLRGTDDVRALLRSYAFYVLPVLNVDGHEASPSTRENADGVDINRDYAYPERSESSSFKEKETRLIKALQDQVGFRAALTFHSGSTSVLWPWCYTPTAASDDARLSSVGAKTAQAMGFNTYAASYFDYPTQGEYIDYAYMKSKTLAFTVEVSLVKTPSVSTIPQIVATAWKGTLALLHALQSNHAPVVATPSQMLVHAPRRGDERLE